MQTHAFYGEIVGIDFHGDGTGFWVANRDEKFRGVMEYERRGYRQSFGWEFLNKDAIEEAGGLYGEQGPNEWCWEMDRRYDQRVVDKARMGRGQELHGDEQLTLMNGAVCFPYVCQLFELRF